MADADHVRNTGSKEWRPKQTEQDVSVVYSAGRDCEPHQEMEAMLLTDAKGVRLMLDISGNMTRTDDFIKQVNNNPQLRHLPRCFHSTCMNAATERCFNCNMVFCAKHQGGNSDFCKDCIKLSKTKKWSHKF